MSVLKSTILTAAPVLGDDPLGSPESYLKYDIKKGASLDSEYEAVSVIHSTQNTSQVGLLTKNLRWATGTDRC